MALDRRRHDLVATVYDLPDRCRKLLADAKRQPVRTIPPRRQAAAWGKTARPRQAALWAKSPAGSHRVPDHNRRADTAPASRPRPSAQTPPRRLPERPASPPRFGGRPGSPASPTHGAAPPPWPLTSPANEPRDAGTPFAVAANQWRPGTSTRASGGPATGASPRSPATPGRARRAPTAAYPYWDVDRPADRERAGW